MTFLLFFRTSLRRNVRQSVRQWLIVVVTISGCFQQRSWPVELVQWVVQRSTREIFRSPKARAGKYFRRAVSRNAGRPTSVGNCWRGSSAWTPGPRHQTTTVGEPALQLPVLTVGLGRRTKVSATCVVGSKSITETTSCCSERPHHCCRIPNKVENIEMHDDISYNLQLAGRCPQNCRNHYIRAQWRI